MAAELDTEAFAAGFAVHGRALWLIAAAWVGNADAADVVQEAAAVAWRQRGRFRVGTDLCAWLGQIVRHTAANWRRRRRPVPTEPVQLDAEPARSVGPTELWPFDADRCGLSDELTRALAGLSEVARACLLLQVVLEHSFAEIATLLGIPENTAASHARRAKLQLRQELTEPQASRPALRKVP